MDKKKTTKSSGVNREKRVSMSGSSSSSLLSSPGGTKIEVDASVGHLRDKLRDLNREQRDTMQRMQKLEEKIEKKRRARVGSSASTSQERGLQKALDNLMKSVGDDKLL